MHKQFSMITLSIIILGQNLFSQIVVEGTVTDNGAQFLGSGAEPVVNALVKVINQSDTNRSFSTYTNAQGQYEIQIIDTEVDAIHSEIPGEFHLYQNYPNPFNPSTVIAFELSRPCVIRLEVYNILGQKIKTLFDGFQISRTGRIVWDGTDDLGQGVPAGVYICSLNGEGNRINKKMLLIDGHGISNVIVSQPAGTNRVDQNELNKQISDQYLLRVTGDDIELYETFLEITCSQVINMTVIRSVIDIDGNVYRTVKIGNQWWMAENLKVMHYRNGDPIPNVIDGTEWSHQGAGAFCDYDNNSSNVATYGRLYNGYAVIDSRNIAPAGWHVPSDAEWKILEMYLGMTRSEADDKGYRGTDEGGKLKETGTVHWASPNTGATNKSGFTALPGGYRGDYGSSLDMQYLAFFWTSTGFGAGNYCRILSYNDSWINRGGLWYNCGFSVRCIRDSDTPVTVDSLVIDPASATLYNCEIQQFSCTAMYSDLSVHDVTDSATWSVAPGTVGSINTNGIFTADPANIGTATITVSYNGKTDTATINVLSGNFETGTMTDIDGNVYSTVKIGNQWWMADNLKVTHYRNGDTIPDVWNKTEWFNLTTGARCDYDNNSSNVATYGRLYNWFAVDDSRNIAPDGWHVPSDEEWKQLEMYLGMSRSEADDMSYRGTNVGSRLKEAGTLHWVSPNSDANNKSGFTALPGGYRIMSGDFHEMMTNAYFWNSTEWGGYAWARLLSNNESTIARVGAPKQSGLSVRCVRDSNTTMTLTSIEISPSSVTLSNSEIRQFTCTATYSDLSTRDVTAFTIWEVTPGIAGTINSDGIFTAQGTNTGIETIIVSYYGKIDSATVTVYEETATDIDGNIYSMVRIGNQVWMVENLKVTRYRNGDPIPNVTGDAAWAALSTGAYCNYGNDENHAAIYGRLYNWYAVDDGRNIAPEGWHVPSDAEWYSLEYYLGGSDIAGGKMKEAGNEHWASPNTGATNESGFSALPGAFRYHDGSYYSMGNYADFWSSTGFDEQSALYRDLSYDNAGVYCNNYNKRYGFAVRLVKDSDTQVTLVSVEITPTDQNLYNCETLQFACIAHYSDLSTRDVTAFTTWEVTQGVAGDIDLDGLFTAHATNTGVEIVRGYFFGMTDSAAVTVSLSPETITDIDGNVYHIVTIGDQVWMAENLKVTRYRNGNEIPNVTDNTEWSNLTTGAYCNYDNDVSNAAIYGRLYNWYAINDSRNIAPDGWHVPSDVEEQILVDYLGGEAIAGGKMKEAGTTHWSDPNKGATNESGFSALPGGSRNGSFHDMGIRAHFWSSSERDGDWAWDLLLIYIDPVCFRHGDNKLEGHSVRCVKD